MCWVHPPDPLVPQALVTLAVTQRLSVESSDICARYQRGFVWFMRFPWSVWYVGLAAA